MNLFHFIIGFIMASCLSLPALAQSETSIEQKTNKKPKNAVKLSKERIETLFAFVDQHHPELRGLLDTLESKKKKRQYQLALTGLNKAVKKLEGIKERSPKRYESALKQWKLESRIKVASAQVKLKDSDEGREKLKSLVTQLVDFHIERMKSDRQQILKRVQQLEKRIADAESKRSDTIEKRLKAVSPKVKKEKKKD